MSHQLKKQMVVKSAPSQLASGSELYYWEDLHARWLDYGGERKPKKMIDGSQIKVKQSLGPGSQRGGPKSPFKVNPEWYYLLNVRGQKVHWFSNNIS